MREKILTLQKIIIENHNNIFHEGGGGRIEHLPDFELYARDYLKFAEEGLISDSKSGLLNCISNLKRAMDCQIDTFFYTVNLYKAFNGKNLKFEKKLAFIEEIGLFSSRSLGKLNVMRNKMEHMYQVPKVVEIELYFELVQALVRSLEMAISLLNWHSELEFSIISEEEGEGDEYGRVGAIWSKYNIEKPSIKIGWDIDKDNIKDEMEVTINNYKEFAYLLKVHLLLYQNTAIGSADYKSSILKINFE